MINERETGCVNVIKKIIIIKGQLIVPYCSCITENKDMKYCFYSLMMAIKRGNAELKGQGKEFKYLASRF